MGVGGWECWLRMHFLAAFELWLRKYVSFAHVPLPIQEVTVIVAFIYG